MLVTGKSRAFAGGGAIGGGLGDERGADGGKVRIAIYADGATIAWQLSSKVEIPIELEL